MAGPISLFLSLSWKHSIAKEWGALARIYYTRTHARGNLPILDANTRAGGALKHILRGGVGRKFPHTAALPCFLRLFVVPHNTSHLPQLLLISSTVMWKLWFISWIGWSHSQTPAITIPILRILKVSQIQLDKMFVIQTLTKFGHRYHDALQILLMTTIFLFCIIHNPPFQNVKKWVPIL